MEVRVITVEGAEERGAASQGAFLCKTIDSKELVDDLNSLIDVFRDSRVFDTEKQKSARVSVAEITLNLGFSGEAKLGLLGSGASMGIEAAITVVLKV